MPIPVAAGQGGLHAGLPSAVGPDAAAGPAVERAAAPSAEAAAGVSATAEAGSERRRRREVLVRGGDIQVHLEARRQGGQVTYWIRARGEADRSSRGRFIWTRILDYGNEQMEAKSKIALFWGQKAA